MHATCLNESIAFPCNVSLLPTAGTEIELAPRFESKHHPPAPTSSIEVEATTNVEIEHAPRSNDAWFEVGLMVLTMYHSEAKLDSPLLAPVQSLPEQSLSVCLKLETGFFQVPEDLSQHVVSLGKAQAKW
ncbi:hypothetical protein Goklo_005393 [Gossypium klotzschianum]|uniref:Uncharacterized protein n=1 Tax=Gossypium klotzschianum TaxID=34286 RepID=A0A7J8VRZ4_9ROSI|nr:hypothetical protein [Gossypium klotzschianum]